MSTAIHNGFWTWSEETTVQATTGPERKSRPDPLFITDAVMPWNGSTMLLELLRKDLAALDEDNTPQP